MHSPEVREGSPGVDPEAMAAVFLEGPEGL